MGGRFGSGCWRGEKPRPRCSTTRAERRKEVARKNEQLGTNCISRRDVVNGALPPSEGLKKESGSVLFGLDGGLDSINLVNFIVIVEERFQKVTGRSLSLMSPEVMVMEESPFRTLGSLA